MATSQQFQYVKLHGSVNWLSALGGSAMVIGAEKENLIAKEPLLQWDSRVFARVLREPTTRRLCVIGYRFGDSNINKIIATAIQTNTRLRLFVVNPTPPRAFHEQIFEAPGKVGGNQKDVGPVLWNAVAGYFPWSMKDIFLDQLSDIRLRELKSVLCG